MPAGLPPRRRVLAARLIAIAADLVQFGFLPLFVEGFASPLNDALDVAIAVLLTWLVGWHWSFLPAFVFELVPGVTLVPTWTAAVLLATRRRPAPPSPLPADEPRGPVPLADGSKP